MKLPSKLVMSIAAITLAGGLDAAVANPVTPPGIGTQVPPSKPVKPLADVQQPSETLVGAQVKDSKGEAVGEVKAVKLDPNGKVVAVDVNVGAKVVALRADSLVFAEPDKTLISKQTKTQIHAMGAM